MACAGCGRSAGDRGAQQVDDAAGDGGGGIDEMDRPVRQLLHAIQQQRVVRAGQHDRIGAFAAGFDEAGGDFGGDIRVAARFRL